MPYLLSQDDRDLLDLLNSKHNLGISETEFSEFASQYNALHHKLRKEHSIRLSQQQIDYIPDVQDTAGQGIGAAIGIAIGVALSFTGVGSAIGILTLVAIGASVGYQLGTLVDPPSLQAQKDQKSNKQKAARNQYGFDSVSTLVTYGEPIPSIYTNIDTNPNGGIRTTGYLIDQRVDTRNGSQLLIQKYILCEGPIGAIDESETLFDNQSTSTFFRNEITQEFRLGYDDQTAFADSNIYSNAVTLSANSTCGCDLRSLVESVKIKRRDILAEADLMRNGSDYTSGTKRIDFEKDDGNYALFISHEALRIKNGKRESGFVEATPIPNDRRIVVGISNDRDPGNQINTLPFCFLCKSDGTWEIRESGVAKVAGTYTRKTAFAVEYLGNTVYYRQNQSVVYTSSILPIYPARLAVMIFDEPGIDANGTRVKKLFFGKNISYSKGRIRPSDTTTIEVDEDDIEKFSPSDIYRVRGKRFQITGKNTGDNTITVDGVLNLREDDEIYAVWEASFETSRKVTRIDVNIATRLWARNPRGELIRHGMVFDVYIKPDGQPWKFLQRFYLSNNVDVDMRRAFKIKNLPENYYQVELRPVEKPNDAYTIEKLGEAGSFDTWNVGTIGANTITMEAQLEDRPSIEAIQKGCDFEGLFDDPDDDADMDEDELKGRKRSVCTQQGATLRITTVNEIINGALNNYAGLVVAKVTLKSSERMSSSPTPSFLITKGLIDRIHIAAGTATDGNTNTVADLTASFIADGVVVGDILRNLDSYQETSIISVAGTNVTGAAVFNWSRGDRYLIYRKDSCNYFPDIYASRLGKEHGVAAQFNADEFIHYTSFVKSRKFCVNRRFFCDTTLKEQMKLNQWVQQEAPASLLINAMIDGMRALAPEQEEPVQGLFTAANAQNWNEQTIEFTKRQTNRVVVTFIDGADDYKLKTTIIMTPDAYHKRVPWCEESVTYTSITYRQQAVYVGALLLKSRQIQDRVSDWESGLYGLAVQPAGLVHAQHTVTEWLDEKNGLILSVVPQPGVPGNYFLETSFPVESSVTRSAYRASVQYRATGHTDYDLSCYTVADAPLHKVVVGGGTQVPQPGDYVALGEDREKKRTFRVSAIEPGEGFGRLKMNAIVWKKELLTLENLYIDGVCQGANSGDSPISDAEMRGWLAGMDARLTRLTRDVRPLLLNSGNLLVNAFHPQDGRGSYFPESSGTSEGQFIGVRSSAEAYLVTRSDSWKNRAIAMAEAAVAKLYDGPIPNTPSTPWGSHWLFNVKAAFPTKGKISPKTINYGYFDVVVSFTNGEGTIASGGQTNGENISDVYSVYATSAKLLWKNVYAPVIFGTEYQVDYWVSNYSLKGQRYRFYPTSAASNGTAPTPTTEAAGKVKLKTSFTGQLKLCYAAYEPTVTIAPGELFEAYPMHRKLVTREIATATDSIPWSVEAYNLLYAITNDIKWQKARDASRYTARIAANIVNLSHYYKISDSQDPYSYPGSQQVVVNRPESAVVASRITTGTKKDWLRLTIAAAAANAYASVEIQNFAVQTALTDAVKISVQASVTETSPGPRQLEIDLSLSSDPFDFSKTFRAYFILSSNGSVVSKEFEMDDFHNWSASISKGNILWYHSIATSPIYTYQGGGGSAVTTKENASVKSTNAIVSVITLDGNSGYAGAGFVFAGLGAVTNNPPSLYLNHTGDTVSLRVKDGSDRKWEVSIEETDGWTRRSFNWSDFRRASGESGSEDPDTVNAIQSVEIQAVGNGESVTKVWYIATSANAVPDGLPLPCTAFKASLVTKIQAAHTLDCGNFRPLQNQLDDLPYTPGVTVFTFNTIAGVLDAWRGNALSGYQDPAYWYRWESAVYGDNAMRFLRDAQDAYYARNGTGIDGPLIPAYSFALWDSGDYQANGINNFGFSSPDPNTGWTGYQVRPLVSAAYAFYNNPGNVLAQRVALRFLTYLYNLYEQRQSGQPPTNYDQGVAPAIRYNEPHSASMIMKAAIYCNVAGVDAQITYKVIEWSYKYLQSQWIVDQSSPDYGSFTGGQPTFVESGATWHEDFGFWVMEEVSAIALLIKELPNLRYPCG